MHRKKGLVIAGALVTLAWLILPTGDPSDVLVTLPLIGIFGAKAVLLTGIALLILAQEMK